MQHRKPSKKTHASMACKGFVARFVSIALAWGGAISVLTGCTALVSGNEPIPVREVDRIQLDEARELVREAPLITHRINNKPVRIYKVAFDGTLNDRAKFPLDSDHERETIVARIDKLVRGDNYERGVGMQGDAVDMFDAMTGASSNAIAERASGKLFAQAREWLKHDPDTEIRIFVTGFSRGAAIARHFMNGVTRKWRTQLGDLIGGNAPQGPLFYAMLFDTVATGQQDKLNLEIPTSVEYLVHFVALDEPRGHFIPTIDVDLNSLPFNSELFDPRAKFRRRVSTVYLPGAHSDVGASYSKGIGDLYIVLAEQFLYMMGLTRTNCWDMQYDPFLMGKHDSRGLLDKLSGVPNVSSVAKVNRQVIPIYVLPQSMDEMHRTTMHLEELRKANVERMVNFLSTTNRMLTAEFSFQMTSQGIEPVGVSKGVDLASVRLVNVEDAVRLQFRFDSGDAVSQILLSPTVVRSIQKEQSKVSLAYLRKGAEFLVAIYVDDVIVDVLSMKETQEVKFRQNQSRCSVEADGASRNPYQLFILRSDGTVHLPQ